MHAVVRADALRGTGLGHVTRSLTLASALVELGWAVTWVSASPTATPLPRGVHSQAIEPDARFEVGPVAAMDPDVVVVDGYDFDPHYFAQLEQRSIAHVVVDDNGETRAMRPMAVINQNPHATAAMYAHLRSHPLLLLGLTYALVRESVIEAAKTRRSSPSAGRLLVSMGGSDPVALTAPVTAALIELGFEVEVVIGALVPNRAAVTEEIVSLGARATLSEPDALPEALARATVAVVGAGVTMWEAAHLGVPTVAVAVADNQANAAPYAESIGFLRFVDARHGVDPAAIARVVRAIVADPAELAEMSRVGSAAVDGRGATRAARELTALVSR